MACCQFCLGFANASRTPRKNVSIFDGEDTALDQAISRALSTPESVTAANLRMFFCLEVTQLLIRRKCDELADQCGLEGVVNPPWLKQPFKFTHEELMQLARHIEALEDMLGSVNFEMKIRKEGNTGSTSAELFSAGLMSNPLIEVLQAFRKVTKKISSSTRRSERFTESYSSIAGLFVNELFTKLGVMPHDYITLITIMFTISSSETVSPWTSKIPFL
jgi:hypothetical protein